MRMPRYHPTSYFTVGSLCCLVLLQQVMPCLRHQTVTEDAFIALKLPHALHIHPHHLSELCVPLTFSLYSCLFYASVHLE